MTNLVPYREGLFVPDNYTFAGLVYFLGGYSGIAQSDWMAFSLTPDSLVLCDRNRLFFSIPLGKVDGCEVETIHGVSITVPSPSGPQDIYLGSAYVIAVTYTHVPSLHKRKLRLCVIEEKAARDWVGRIEDGIERYWEILSQRTAPSSGSGP